MQDSIKYCDLDPDKLCDNCNKCNICDLDPEKICDSCGKCIEMEYGDYNELKLDGIIENEEDLDEYLFEVENQPENELYDQSDNNADHSEIKVEYIEDIPELKKEYDKIIESILSGKEPKESSYIHVHNHDHVHEHGNDCSHNHDDKK